MRNPALVSLGWRPPSVLLLCAAVAGLARAQNNPDWTTPFSPFRIVDSLYYVGSKGLANYLIATPQGHILINSDLEDTVPLIRASVEQLGFKFGDIKILLISHAHWDHDAGSAMIKQLTGAKYMVMDAKYARMKESAQSFQHPCELYFSCFAGIGDGGLWQIRPALRSALGNSPDGAGKTARVAAGHAAPKERARRARRR